MYFRNFIEFVQRNGLMFAAIVFAALLVAAVAGPRAEPQAPVCQSIEATQQKLADANGGAKPVRHLRGDEAQAVATTFGADFKASDALIYVAGEAVYIAAFVDGCFRGLSSPIPMMMFMAMAPGILSGAQ